MANAPKGRVLKDLSPASQALIQRLMAGEVSAEDLGSVKEEGARVISYTPKKGKNAGVPGPRLNVTGNFYPLVLTQAQAKVLMDFHAVVSRFAKTGQ